MSRNGFPRHPLTRAILSGLILAGSSAIALAQENTPTDLGRVTVTGSLIPQTQIENHTPVLTVTAEDIQTRGFTSVAEVLQQNSLTTGGLQAARPQLRSPRAPKPQACSASARATPST